jgi:hypothetical protein
MNQNGESTRPKVVELFARFRKKEMRDWEHATEEFKRITGSEAT